MLLFGEHTVLHGSAAYALPLPTFQATVVINDSSEASPLRDWYAYAHGQAGLHAGIDFTKWATHANNLFVESSIPMGYGLGSSGALCSCILELFPNRGLATMSLIELRQLLGQLESYFHGSSSGLDPLVSYLNQHIYLHATGELEPLSETTQLFAPAGYRWFLLDSGQARQGDGVIAAFAQHALHPTWIREILQPMIALVNTCIESLRKHDSNSLAGGVKALSAVQLRHLDFLIPAQIKTIWTDWLAHDLAYLKICGAGGGGFFLGLARVDAPLKDERITWLT